IAGGRLRRRAWSVRQCGCVFFGHRARRAARPKTRARRVRDYARASGDACTDGRSAWRRGRELIIRKAAADEQIAFLESNIGRDQCSLVVNHLRIFSGGPLAQRERPGSYAIDDRLLQHVVVLEDRQVRELPEVPGKRLETERG